MSLQIYLKEDLIFSSLKENRAGIQGAYDTPGESGLRDSFDSSYKLRKPSYLDSVIGREVILIKGGFL